MTKLTIDVGNTSTLFCFFSLHKVIFTKRVHTKELSDFKLNKIINEEKIDKDFKKFSGIIISSVVPSVDKILKDFFKKKLFKFFFLKDIVNNFKLKTKIRNRKEIGDDRIVNMLYAKKKFGKSVIVIDFGTATTLDVLNKDGIYNGGVITPGIELSLGSLKKMTAKLPLVKFKKTKKIMGTSTINAIQSGFFWGYVSMIEGLIKKINLENEDNHKIVLTGGNANFFKNMFENVYLIDDLFTSRGLHYLINEFDK